MGKPSKPSPDFPLFAHASGKWVKKIKGKLRYFGTWEDPKGALAKYRQWTHSNINGVSGQDAKPKRPDGYPLYAHANGQWAKRIRGRLHYFGPWADPQGALDRYLRQKDDLYAGRTPSAETNGWTVKMLATKFLNAKRRKMETGELSAQMHHDYLVVCEEVLKHLGANTPITVLRPTDFEQLRTKLAKTRGPVTLKNWIIRVRSIFKYAYTERIITEPMHYGDSFSVPSAKTLRVQRNQKPERLFEPEPLRLVLAKLDTGRSSNLYSMVLLGVNCGFGVTDCAFLTFRHLDLEGGWHSFPRPKTGVVRAARLWPETIEALQRSIERRKAPKDPGDSHKVFITLQGNCYRGKKLNDKNPASQRFSAHLRELGIKHDGLNFGALRHTLQTIGEGAGDRVALQHMMGHAPDNRDMSSIYRERVFRERLIAVSDYVRDWLFGALSK